jgi:hypothetical protein
MYTTPRHFKNKREVHGRVTNEQTYKRPPSGNLRKSTSLLLFTHPIMVKEVHGFPSIQILKLEKHRHFNSA